MSTVKPPDIDLGQYKFGWHDPANYVFEPKRGLNADVVREISFLKGEPEWMLKFRLRALEIFERKPMPQWGGDLGEIDFQNIFYFIRSSEKQSTDWDDVPSDIKNTFDRLGIPEAEQKYLSGVSAQYESEVVYHSLREDLEKQGRHLLRHGHGAARARGPVPRALGDGDPAGRQQARRPQLGRVVGRFVHLGAAGRAGRDPAAGLLPHQRREHGPVRADAHHLRARLLRALRRGLHRAGLHQRLACTRPWSRSSSRKARAAATRPSRTGRPTSSTWSPSGRRPTRTPPWSGSTATSAPS